MIQLTETLFVVAVPVDASDFKNENCELTYKSSFGTFRRTKRYRQPDFNFKIIGTVTKDGIDFDPTPYVKEAFDDPSWGNMYWNYIDKAYYLPFSAKNSFRSLLQSKGLYFVNPMGVEPNEDDYEKYPLPIEFDEKAESAAFWKRKKKIEFDWQSYQDNLVEKLVIIEIV